jgi:thiosulfate dehydrogenase [quinone] large subunit
MSDPTSPKADAPCCDYALTPAYWLLRIWLGLRLLASGLEKFKVQGEIKYSLEAYKSFVDANANLIADQTFLPAPLCKAFMFPLGFAMLVCGFFILVGFLNRLSLFVGGLIFVALSFGMMLLPDPHQTLDLGIYVVFFAAALALVRHNRLALTRW